MNIKLIIVIEKKITFKAKLKPKLTLKIMLRNCILLTCKVKALEKIKI